MRAIAWWVSLVSLAGTIAPPVMYLAGHIELDPMKLVMLVATIAWFCATPLWMNRDASS